jgi:hypothetical protein
MIPTCNTHSIDLKSWEPQNNRNVSLLIRSSNLSLENLESMTVTKILIILLQWMVGSPLVLFIGLPFLIFSTNDLLQKNLSQEDKSEAWIGFVIGASSTACGGWLMLNAWQKIKAQEDEDATNTMLKLDLIFMEQIQSNQGNISSISLATAAKVPIEAAHIYLDMKSKEIECQLNVDEDGAVLYHFTLPRSMM